MTNRETTQNFTVQGTTARLVSPADGGLIGIASQNSRGFLDVTFGFPSGKTPDLDTIYDLDAEFSIDPATGHASASTATQAPVLLSQSGNTYTFRYFTLGSYTSGAVTVTLIAGQDRLHRRQPQRLDRPDRGHRAGDRQRRLHRHPLPADHRLRARRGLDHRCADAEFVLGGAGAGTAALSSTYAPLRLTSSNTFRYFLTGDFAAGEVTVAFLEDGLSVSDTSAGERRRRRRQPGDARSASRWWCSRASLAEPIAGRERRRRCR